MRLGIDLGTTRTLVAACDRGNYPVLQFTDGEGDAFDFVPTVSAELEGRLVHGFEAEAAALAGAPHLRSWKRLLGRHGPEHRVGVGAVELSLLELATEFLRALRQSILEGSNLPPGLRGDRIEAVVSVPANAHSSQRWATLEAFRRAGFEVRRLVNEPSAAGIEFAHRHKSALNSRRENVAVYDLGGGTFDAALVCLAEGGHDVVATAGVQELGGDDFDRVLAELALEKADVVLAPDQAVWPLLLAECRAVKEGIGASTRRVTVDLSSLGEASPPEPVSLQVADYFERLRPWIDQSLAALASVLGAESSSSLDLENAASDAGVAGLYVVGGASALPLVARHLRDRFGRRVHRSPHPAGAIAMGLAIAADADAENSLVRERFSRHLGVFREAESGQNKVFDRIFASGTPMPGSGDGPLVATRLYRAAHNVGQLRFVECGGVSEQDEPTGDITPHATVHFPYAKSAREASLEGLPIERLGLEGPRIEERYEVDAAGVVTVTVRDLDDGFVRAFTL
jgi:molecular chaperone DnaK (HSP70)